MRQKDFWIEGKGHPISDLYRFVQDCTELMIYYRITFELFKSWFVYSSRSGDVRAKNDTGHGQRQEHAILNKKAK